MKEDNDGLTPEQRRKVEQPFMTPQMTDRAPTFKMTPETEAKLEKMIAETAATFSSCSNEFLPGQPCLPGFGYPFVASIPPPPPPGVATFGQHVVVELAPIATQAHAPIPEQFLLKF